MIIVLGGAKGGVGKTTIATNLAAIDVLAGKDVLLVDCDRQGASSAWGAVRDETDAPRVSVIQKFGGLSLTEELKALEKKYDRVYVDAGGYDAQELRASLLAAKLILVPVRPSQIDTWTIPRIVEITTQSQLYNPQLEVRFVVNGAHTNLKVTDADDLLELADEEAGVVFTHTIIHSRRAFSKAPAMGVSVVELQGRDLDKKAVNEVMDLWREVIGEEQAITHTA